MAGTAVTCGVCGRASDPRTDGDPPLTWTADLGPGAGGPAQTWTCPGCTRRHLRSIEGRLDQDYW